MTFDIKKFLAENKIQLHEKKHNWNALAGMLEKRAKSVLAQGRKEWSKDKDYGDREEMIAMYNDDYKDHMRIAKLLRAGKIEAASKTADSLDTASREEIPPAVWDAMDDEIGYGQ